MSRPHTVQRKKLSGMTAPQLRALRIRLRKTTQITQEAVWELRRRYNKGMDICKGLYRLTELTKYWEGKLIGENCPARERVEDNKNYYICHCKPTSEWGRTQFYRTFYPRCLKCRFTDTQKIQARSFGRIFNGKKKY